jgi:hypothetical protein
MRGKIASYGVGLIMGLGMFNPILANSDEKVNSNDYEYCSHRNSFEIDGVSYESIIHDYHCDNIVDGVTIIRKNDRHVIINLWGPQPSQRDSLEQKL